MFSGLMKTEGEGKNKSKNIDLDMKTLESQ